MTRITRSAAAREAALLAAKIKQIDPQIQDSTIDSLEKYGKTNGSRTTPPAKRHTSSSNTKSTRTSHKKQKVRSNAPAPSSVNELPHNLGSLVTTIPEVAEEQTTSAAKNPVKEELDVLARELQSTVDKATELPVKAELEKKKAAKKTKSYGLSPGVTPFPSWAHPTPEECEEVNRLLSSIHGEIVPPSTIPEPSLTVTGCGEVPSVLDALIRTLLSGATTGRNSAMAFDGLVQKFGILEEGIGKGSVNWDAVRRASVKDVFEAIKRGGLADIKSKNLKAILDMVYDENQERKNVLTKGESFDSDNRPDSEKEYEIACAEQNFLSLNHLHSLSTEQVMTELVKYPGIGPKTAACVLLFCLQRPCFAVDTHIFRICKWLNWVPPGKVTEITAFSHLEVRIPDHLKYSLHQLFIRHGKSCPRCRAITGQSSAGWEDGCVIDHLVTRTGKRKGGL